MALTGRGEVLRGLNLSVICILELFCITGVRVKRFHGLGIFSEDLKPFTQKRKYYFSVIARYNYGMICA